MDVRPTDDGSFLPHVLISRNDRSEELKDQDIRLRSLDIRRRGKWRSTLLPFDGVDLYEKSIVVGPT